jgi:hypothetical protein
MNAPNTQFSRNPAGSSPLIPQNVFNSTSQQQMQKAQFVSISQGSQNQQNIMITQNKGVGSLQSIPQKNEYLYNQTVVQTSGQLFGNQPPPAVATSGQSQPVGQFTQ